MAGIRAFAVHAKNDQAKAFSEHSDEVIRIISCRVRLLTRESYMIKANH